MIHDSRRKRYQCKNCRHQTTLTAGTIFEAAKLALTVWFQAIYLISQAKTGLSALALKRQLGVSYPTAWMIHHKLIHTMQRRDGRYLLVMAAICWLEWTRLMMPTLAANSVAARLAVDQRTRFLSLPPWSSLKRDDRSE